MRVTPAEVLELAVRAEAARQPNLARELFMLAGRMDWDFDTDTLDESRGPAMWSRGFRLSQRLGLSPESIDVATAAGRVS